MSKSNKHNTSKSGLPKNGSHVTEEYLNYISHSKEPATDSFFQRLAIELVTWAREDKQAFIMAQFYLMKGINEPTYYRWVNKYPELAGAHDVAIAFLANRRELYLFKQDNASVRYMMPQYAKLWLKEDERRATQRKDIATESKGNIIVNMDKMPETKEVPKRKKNE
jgi:hypothetical protein